MSDKDTVALICDGTLARIDSASGEVLAETRLDAALEVLHRIFGFTDFRPTQAEAIAHLLEGHDCLLLMPTGGGKSLCYQVPSLVRSGTGIVISPLIALMEDQVHGLQELGIRAAYINSTLSPEQKRETVQALAKGDLDLLYIAPERLLMEQTLDLFDHVEIALFAIDEAHCVSQWGHDFRKEYQKLGILQSRYSGVPRLALTATADQRTREEIISQLGLEQAAHLIDSFDRPNIRYQLSASGGGREALWKFIESEHPGDAGIVYCLSRRKVDEVAAWLNEKGRPALPYHAGMSDQERSVNQHRFLTEDGLIVVATIAFGMGIDKPDVRFVAHLNLPKSIEAYYQETGRAGRDGQSANAWMAYTLQDVIMLRRMVEESDAPPQQIQVMQRKLNSMLSFCELIDCRRQSLLAYFGEVLTEPCGNCDNCLYPPDSVDATREAQMALSCAYRTGQRFGVTYLVDILLGKENDRLLRNRHHDLNVFGMGTHWSASQWRSLYRQLIALGYIRVDDDYGSLVLTETCRPLLKGELVHHTRKQVKTPRSRSRRQRTVDGDVDSELFQQLRELRSAIANERGVPPYMIFHDNTLMIMSETRPGTLEEMATISGVGAKKLESYGPVFLKSILSYI